MKIARLAGSALMVTLAIGLTVVSDVSAEAHFRWQDVGTHFVGLSGLTLLRDVNTEYPRLYCLKDLALGIITSLDLVGSLFIHFLECRGKETETSESCEVNSTNSETPGLILVLGLHAVLGLILPRSGSGVGLLLLPAVGHTFVTLAKSCLPEEHFTGNIAGEVTPVAQALTLPRVIFSVPSLQQGIKEIDVLGAKIKPELVGLFAITLTDEATELFHWLTAVEVT